MAKKKTTKKKTTKAAPSTKAVHAPPENKAIAQPAAKKTNITGSAACGSFNVQSGKVTVTTIGESGQPVTETMDAKGADVKFKIG